MLASETYIAFTDATASAYKCLTAPSEMKMGHLTGRPILRWLDLLEQVSAGWLQLEGKKPWRTVTPASGAIQQENRQLGLMTRKALTALAKPCFPADRLSVPGAHVPRTDRQAEVRVSGRIGGRHGRSHPLRP